MAPNSLVKLLCAQLLLTVQYATQMILSRKLNTINKQINKTADILVGSARMQVTPRSLCSRRSHIMGNQEALERLIIIIVLVVFVCCGSGADVLRLAY